MSTEWPLACVCVINHTTDQENADVLQILEAGQQNAFLNVHTPSVYLYFNVNSQLQRTVKYVIL